MPMFIRLIVAVFFLVILPVRAHALTPGQVFNKVKDAVVVVKSLDSQGKVKSLGSGVLLPSGRIATNCHVVEGGSSYQVRRGKLLVIATLYAEDGDKDICILEAKGIKGKPTQFGKAAGLKVGDAVYAVGAPQGLELSLSDGIVAQLRGGPPPFIQTTAAISPGSSGGGLFDERGRLVGLTTFNIVDGQNLNFAMPVEWIGEVKPGRKTAAEGHNQTVWLKRVLALEALKDWHGLLDWSMKWTNSEPNNATAWYCLGIAYGNLNRHDEAIEANHQALRINPESDDAWFNLGIAYGNLNRYDSSIDALLQVLRINPERDTAWNCLGIAYGNLNRLDDAIKAYNQALRINPENGDAWDYLGSAFFRLERYNDAIEPYRQALRINPENGDAWNNLGIAFSRIYRFDDSIEAHRQAIRFKPEEPRVWNNLGIAYALSGNNTAALDTVKELRRLDPEMADKLFNLIVAAQQSKTAK